MSFRQEPSSRGTRRHQPQRPAASSAVTEREPTTDREGARQQVGSRGHENAKLIGQEALAARATEIEAVVELFDSVLAVSAPAVELVAGLGLGSAVGDDKARVVAGLTVLVDNDLRLDQDSALMRPLALFGSIHGLSEKLLALVAGRDFGPSFLE